ncbi:hypothetical protein IQ231_07110 [Cuspidothrix issatschenkoi LEGE 03284]|uniref:hypothetical protein n=1 Tax=Cuspidothrix issatschenkoi TaxID=230752 RepID=UPI0018803BE5|nr:hypothetical protein [Cuspidothrix issatschenkoi]MBE9231462.1 hypothetical protein [Cuspidothrix issatschenkoi LEGE 03284]
MPEDAGKKRYINEFLQIVARGSGFIEDIRIERAIRQPGSDGEGSTARSLSGRKINNITELLEDDLKHTFDEGFFAFRFVAALVGSGKTSLLTYLNELAKTKSTYFNHSIVFQFRLSDITPLGDNFGIKFYCHILADTFWQLLNNQNLSNSVKLASENILSEYLESTEVAQLIASKTLKPFYAKFKKFMVNYIDEHFFFDVIEKISDVDPQFTFIYLVDELDALEKFTFETEQIRLTLKQLIKRAFEKFKSKIRLLIYVVGTSENVGSFIAQDSVIQAMIGNLVINLNKGYTNEFEIIKEKINNRIKGAYSGYKNFNQAWEEIQNISINSTNTLREFCQNYGNAMLEIHQKYFQETPEQIFEGNARNLVESQCKQLWADFLNKKAYTLSVPSTTTVIANHAFDCYVELIHNDYIVAKAFGEAKNYELLSGHLQTFTQWLEDVNFEPAKSNGHPPDLSFMIAPSCPPLLQRKLELKNIKFIQSEKRVNDSFDYVLSDPPFGNNINYIPNWTFSNSGNNTNTINTHNPINVNKANKLELTSAFKGTGIKQGTIDKLINKRQQLNLDNLDTMAEALKLTSNVKQKLQTKLDKNEICF